MINIHLVLVTYAIDPTPLLESLSGDHVTWHIYNHAAHPAVLDVLEPLKRRSNFCVHDYRVNRGLSRSWNDGLIEAMHMSAEVSFILNDDITASRADMRRVAEAALAYPDYGIVGGQMWNESSQSQIFSSYGFCVLTPHVQHVVGYFDQNLWPIYFEDSDYSRRCALCGIPFYDVGQTGIIHEGNGTLRHDPDLRAQNAVTFQANAAYYTKKWGGPPGQETYLLPFNNTAFGWQIAASQRHDPYPGFGRTDMEIVER